MKLIGSIVTGLKEILNTPSKLYLDVPFSAKDEAKQLGAQWDRNRQVWFILSNQQQEKFEKWLPGSAAYNRVYLTVPYEEKDQVRELGAAWDGQARRWYVLSSSYSAVFARWNRINAVLIDPFKRTVERISIEDYARDALGNPVVPEDTSRVWDSWLALAAGDEPYSKGSTSFSHGIHAIIDNHGLLREKPAFWRLEHGLTDNRNVRAGRYLIYAFTQPSRMSEFEYTTPYETDIPDEYGVEFWRSQVTFLDYEEGNQWCVDHGLRT